MRNFLKNILNNAMSKIVRHTPPAAPKIPPPYTTEYEASVGLREAHAKEFNSIAAKHCVQGYGIIFNRETGAPEFHIMLVKGDKADTSDIPKKFKSGLPVVIEYREIARG